MWILRPNNCFFFWWLIVLEGLRVVAMGSPGEKITVGFIDPSKDQVVVNCEFKEGSESLTISVPQKTCM